MSNPDEAIERGMYGGDVHAVDEAITLANTPRIAVSSGSVTNAWHCGVSEVMSCQ